MKKMVKVAALLAAMALVTVAFAEGFPEYLIVADKTLWNYRNGLLADLVIPEGIVSIGEDAFNDCSNLKSVVIPDSVTRIGSDAFRGCRSLAVVTIPATVTTIDTRAFYNCPNLKDIKYTGTKAQWANIRKGSIGILRIVVHCTDGDVFVRSE